MSLKSELYQTRRDAGLCVQCGVDANGKSRCRDCKDNAALSRNKTIEKRKDAGLCPTCGKPAKPGCIVCDSCSKKAGQSASRRYQRNKAAGLCPYCGGERGEGFACDECRARTKEYQTESYETRKDAGVCVVCGTADAENDLVTCKVCTLLVRARSLKRYQRLKLAAFTRYGGPVCVGCGEDEILILEIDHIAGGGCKHLQEIGGNLYAWLAANNYPPGYRVLCPTCNKKAHAGILKA